jgi:hypothetical protein
MRSEHSRGRTAELDLAAGSVFVIGRAV